MAFHRVTRLSSKKTFPIPILTQIARLISVCNYSGDEDI